MINQETLSTDELPYPSAPSYIERMAKTYQCGDLVFREGDIGREMFIVLKGCVAISRATNESEVHLGEFKAGDFFGEMALVGSGLRTGTATVMAGGTELVSVNQARFVYLVSQQPAFALSVMRQMGRRVETMNHRLAELGEATLEGATP